MLGKNTQKKNWDCAMESQIPYFETAVAQGEEY